ncbi:MAG: hypothetical protein HYX92_16530 [Chloroflexi bacterium]|nr:hypothetical protein [Chloroflexota bacterium]
MQFPCVSLDLETTGLSPENDEITEVGAVKFLGDEVIATFSSLVNPGRRIPYFIQVLTGIQQEDVDNAPPISAVGRDLASFIGSCPIVGQNIPFDVSFLAAKGIVLLNPTYDTWELSSILLPSLPDHGLGSLVKALGVSTSPTHRAPADAMAAKDVFLALLRLASELKPSLLRELQSVGARLNWPLSFVFEVAAGSPAPEISERGRPRLPLRRPEPLVPVSEKVALDIDQLTDLLKTVIPQGFPGFEYRVEQERMMVAVAQALNRDEHLLVEAGTGTGKSLAYLLPCLHYALTNNTPVVISTNTINLQEQLMHKDIPDLLKALTGDGDFARLKALQLKGRNNYLCLRRLESLRGSEGLSLDEGRLLMRLLVWLGSTVTGDRAELNLSAAEGAAWSKVCAHGESCLGPRCRYHEDGTCFFYRARWAAEGAHVIVVNHALLLSDMVSGANVLPDYQYLVVDEAHNLEKEATDQLGFSANQRDVDDYLSRVGGASESRGRPSGLLGALLGGLAGGAPILREAPPPLVADVEKAVREAAAQASFLFSGLAALVESCSSEAGDYDLRLRLTRAVRSQPAWSDVEIAWDDLSKSLNRIESKLSELGTRLEGLEDPGGDRDELKMELAALIAAGAELRHRMGAVISAPEADSIYWAQLSRQSNAVTVSAAPLHVGPALEKHLFLQKASVILTSATLSTEGTFGHIRERLSLSDAQELLVNSPFDYGNAALIYLPQDIPNPSHPAYGPALERALIELGRAVQGRTLVLFTSHAALRSALAAIRAPLEREGILVLGQGVHGSPKQLLNLLKANPRTIVLGTASLWEGVDVVGEALSVLVIAKLPFVVPTDPVFAARSELLDDPFNQYAVPQAVLRFKQGFGRLIRSRTDRGVVVILDRRIQNRHYGAAFLDSLPRCATKRGPVCNLPEEALTWLGKGKQPMLEGF